MKDRRAPRGGAKNDQPELLEEMTNQEYLDKIGHRPLCRCDECLANLCKACGGGGYIRDAMQTFCKPCTCDKGKELAVKWDKEKEAEDTEPVRGKIIDDDYECEF